MLISDTYSAHRSVSDLWAADQFWIDLLLIPPGFPDRLQRLDPRLWIVEGLCWQKMVDAMSGKRVEVKIAPCHQFSLDHRKLAIASDGREIQRKTPAAGRTASGSAFCSEFKSFRLRGHTHSRI
jgi:hypothetical protein